MSLTHDLRASLLKADRERAEARQHRKCHTHGDTRIVCHACVRVFCPYCLESCPRCGYVPNRHYPYEASDPARRVMRTVAPPPQEPRLRDIHHALTPLHLLRIKRHDESGHWQALFPYRMHGYANAADLETAVLRVIRDWAESTPFGSGRGFRPDCWYVTFKLKGAL